MPTIPARKIWWMALLMCFACLPESPAPLYPQEPARKRALLIGINEYSAFRPRVARDQNAGRQSWPNLRGTVNDVEALRETLVALYAFDPREIVTLTDRKATRQAILRAIEEHLLEGTKKGDVIFFYFSGHGSQVRNLLSGEADRLDESLVPADAHRGAPDLRDKELRRLFNRILDRGARLTVVLDSCHSGSGVRGLPDGGRPKGLEPDLRDAADGADAGPSPEERGALVLAAAQDDEPAWETWDEQGRPRGAFSLALLRALRDAASGEPAEDLFLRARARLQHERRYQEPVLAGSETARRAPFLGDRPGGRRAGSLLAVEEVRGETVILQGGWVNGIAVGSELRLGGQLGGQPGLQLEVTALLGLSRCEARIVSRSRAVSNKVETGALVEVVSWAAAPDQPLRAWIPRTADLEAALALEREIAIEAPGRGIARIADPVEQTPTHVLRWSGREWELLGPDRRAEPLGARVEVEALLDRVAQVPSPALFVQLPAPAALAQALAIGPGTDHTGVVPADAPEEAHYLLVGRLAGERLEYAWVRPGDELTGRPRIPLPARTAWHPLDRSRAAGVSTAGLILQDSILRLRKIQAWQELEAPPGLAAPFRLALHRADDGRRAENGVLTGQGTYSLFLHPQSSGDALSAGPRRVYVFVIDSHGRSILLFPRHGSVENQISPPAAPHEEIPLGSKGSIQVSPPYGTDTYFLLTSDEPLPNPWVLEWDGVRARGPRGKTPLEELLSVTGGASRSVTPVATPASWSIQKLLFESVPPGPPHP
jgi:uncharacterized caspase-like protein